MSASEVDSPALARTAPGMLSAVAGQHGAAVRGHLGRRQAEQAQQVRVGAEAAVAHADAVLGAEPRGHQRVGHAVDDERRHRQRRRRGRRPEQAHASGSRRARVAARRASCVVVRGDRRPADALELVDGGVQGDRADHVGRAGLLALGRLGPHDLVEIDEVDGAAAGQERIAVGERVAGDR